MLASPLSPVRPPLPNLERLNADAVSPVSPLVPMSAPPPAAVANVARAGGGRKPSAAAINSCAECLHLLRRGTCAEPVAAGLVETFGIVWPPDGHWTNCHGFTDKVPLPAANRPHQPTQADADECHARGWNVAEIAALASPATLFAELSRAAAEDLAS